MASDTLWWKHLWRMSLALSFLFWATNQSSYKPNAISQVWTVFVNFFFKSCQIVVRTGTSMKLISFAFQRLEVMLWLSEWTWWSFGLVKVRKVYLSLCVSSPAQFCWAVGCLVGNRAMPRAGPPYSASTGTCLCGQSLTVVDVASAQRRGSRRLEIDTGVLKF